jgi:predicted AlkP superfamily phosphohydrolase/phosphomutase
MTLGTLAVAGASCARGPREKPVRRAAQKVFLVGFDGMDPTLARRWMAEGKLPNLARLAREGTFAVLATTQPSESPTAWASFATGVNPGKHNIYDFLVRDFETYMPDLAMVKREAPRFLWGLFPTKRPQVTSTRGGTSFWVHAGRDGIRSIVLTVPVTFPVETIRHGDLLAGFPLPDVRGTIGTFSYWATDLSSFEEGSTEFGGILKRLAFVNGVATTTLVGPQNPIVRQEEAALRARRDSGGLSEAEEERLSELARRRDLTLPLEIRWSAGDDEAEVRIAGSQAPLRAGEWTGWVPVTFKVNPFVRVHGMLQFHLVRADRELQLYASPVNLDPRRPPLPISAPAGFSRRLARDLGLYRTLGWAEATWPLNEERLDEAAFMADCERAFEDRERIFLTNLERDDWDLFLAVIETTDRVSHMMWRFLDPRHPRYDPVLAERHGDAVERIYRRCDDLVGRLRRRVPPDAVFIVMSDHGFHSFRRSVNLNTWLLRNGYLAFAGQGAGEKRLDDLFGHGRFWEGVDWTRTRAYALGLGQIYFNLRGRESQGIVSAGSEYARLQAEIQVGLAGLSDPETGERVFGGIYRRDDLYHGEYLVNAPDLQVGFNDGYRVGWQDTLGTIRPAVVEDNDKKWSGDHCGTAREISGGVLFINRPITRPDPHIMDLAPTILELLGVPLPEDLDGRPFLTAGQASRGSWASPPLP